MVTVSLSEVLEVREGTLYEYEFWSLLIQAACTYQDHLISSGAAGRNFIVNKENILLTPIGTIQLVAERRTVPVLCELNVRDYDIEGAFIYGLGLTLSGLFSVPQPKSHHLMMLISAMLEENPRNRLTIKKLFSFLRTDAIPCRAPSNYIITQMYREVMGQDPAVYLCRTLHEENESLSEDIVGNAEVLKLSDALSKTKKTEESVKSKSKIIRAPSQLYKIRVNRNTSSNLLQLSFVGPEFVARSLQPSVIINTLNGSATKESALVCCITIVLLGGQRLEVFCNSRTNTVGDLVQVAIDYEKLADSRLFGLAVIDQKSEVYFLDRDTKLYRIINTAEYDKNQTVSSLTVYFRFKYYINLMTIEKFDARKDLLHHLLYLQLRRDWIDGRIQPVYNVSVDINIVCEITALSLQAEFGDTIAEDSESYFLPEHYFPPSIIENWGQKKFIEKSKKIHVLHHHLTNNEAEISYILQLEKSGLLWNTYDYSVDQVRWNENINGANVSLSLEGIQIRDLSNKYLPWEDCTNISWNKKSILLIHRDLTKIHLVCERMKSKYIWKYIKDMQKTVWFLNNASGMCCDKHPNGANNSSKQLCCEKSPLDVGPPKLQKKKMPGLEFLAKMKTYNQLKNIICRSYSEPDRHVNCDSTEAKSMTSNVAIESQFDNNVCLLEIHIPDQDKSFSFNTQETLSESLMSKMDNLDALRTRAVILRRQEDESWGLLLSEGSDCKAYVQGLNPAGAAAAQGTLKIGDCILSVDHLKVTETEFSQLVQYLKSKQQVQITFEEFPFDTIKEDQTFEEPS